jgi:hypothetical protein
MRRRKKMPKKKNITTEVSRPAPLAVSVFRELKAMVADVRRHFREILNMRRRHVS